jgi:hydroxyacylglutathione hydrolase
MIVTQLEVGSMRNFAYVIGDHEGAHGAVIDPSAELDRIEAEVRRWRLSLDLVLNTHSHHDHIGGNERLRRQGARLVAHPSAPTHPELPTSDGQVLMLGELAVRVIHTPGHSRDSVCFVAGGHLFSGDTLFVGECGRVDLAGSSPRDMYHSLLEVLRSLPDELLVMPGHNYGPVPSRLLGDEKRLNYTLAPRALDAFLEFMSEP